MKVKIFILGFFIFLLAGNAKAQLCSTGGLCSGYNSAECSNPVIQDCSFYPRCTYSGVIGGFYCKRNCHNTGVQGSCNAGSVCLCVNQSVCPSCTSTGQNLAQCNDDGCGAVDSQPPTVAISYPTTNATYNSSISPIRVSGTASDNLVLSEVGWSNSRNSGFVGGSGKASGTANWSANYINLESGSNVITVTAKDGRGNTGTDTITINYTPPASQGYPAITIAENSTNYSVTISDPDALSEVAYAWGEKPSVYFLLPFASEDSPVLSGVEEARYNHMKETLPAAWDSLTGNRLPMKFNFLPPFRVTSYSKNEDDWFNYVRKTVAQFETDNAAILQHPAIYVFMYPEPYFNRTYINMFGSEEKDVVAEVSFSMFNDTSMNEYGESANEIIRDIMMHEIVHNFAQLPNNSNFPPGTDRYFWLSHPAGFSGIQEACDEQTSLLDCDPYGRVDSPTGTDGYYEAYSILSLARLYITKENFGNREPELSPIVEMAMGLRSRYEDAPFMFHEGYVSGIESGRRFTLVAAHDYNISSRRMYDYTSDRTIYHSLYWNVSYDNTKISLPNTTRTFNVPKSGQDGRSLIVYASDALNPGYFKVFDNNAASEGSQNSPPASPTGLSVKN